MSNHRVEHHNHDQLVVVALDPHAVPDHAEFPHPLIAVDYDGSGVVIGFSASGPAMDAALSIYADWHKTSPQDTSKLVAALERADDLVAA
jgi:hypothetical protein